jgi:putative transposase
MGRPLRYESADTLYHALARGNERREVFYDDGDREHFLDLLGLLEDRFEAEPWAYVLMANLGPPYSIPAWRSAAVGKDGFG